MPVFVDCILI